MGRRRRCGYRGSGGGGRRPRGFDAGRTTLRARIASPRRSRSSIPNGGMTSSSTCRATCRPSNRTPCAPPSARSQDGAVDIATLATPIRRDEERDDPNVVKAIGTPVATGRLRALYFTRARAPWGEGELLHHIGLYAYRRAALETFCRSSALGAGAARAARAIAGARSRHADRHRARRRRAARRRHARRILRAREGAPGALEDEYDETPRSPIRASPARIRTSPAPRISPTTSRCPARASRTRSPRSTTAPPISA